MADLFKIARQALFSRIPPTLHQTLFTFSHYKHLYRLRESAVHPCVIQEPSTMKAHLPPEIFEQIFSHLDDTPGNRKDLFHCVFASQLWHDMAIPVLWSRRPSIAALRSMDSDIASSFTGHVQSLVLSQRNRDKKYNCTAADVVALGHYPCPNLEGLTINGIHDQRQRLNSLRTPQFEHLSRGSSLKTVRLTKLGDGWTEIASMLTCDQ